MKRRREHVASFVLGFVVCNLLQLHVKTSSSFDQTHLRDGLSLLPPAAFSAFENPTGTAPHAYTHFCNVSDNESIFHSLPPIESPIRVGLLYFRKLMGEIQHFFHDGVNKSRYLKLEFVCQLSNSTTCSMDHLLHAQTRAVQVWVIPLSERYKAHHVRKIQAILDESVYRNWNVLFFDYSDDFKEKFSSVFQLGNATHTDKLRHVRVAIRAITTERKFLQQQQQIVTGVIDRDLLQSKVAATGGPILHMPYAVRSDTVEAIGIELRASPLFGGGNNNISNSAADLSMLTADHVRMNYPFPPPLNYRPIDVTHLWPLNDTRNYGRYRNEVSHIVHSMNSSFINGKLVRTSVDQKGERYSMGRNLPQLDYVRALLSSKIIVVTQRDAWEDHYRLMEALAGGAMVLHDTMLSLPRWLENGTSVVFFSDLEELRRLAEYYLHNEEERLQIAMRGWAIAMGRHRSWHRVEQLFFGCPVTDAF